MMAAMVSGTKPSQRPAILRARPGVGTATPPRVATFAACMMYPSRAVLWRGTRSPPRLPWATRAIVRYLLLVEHPTLAGHELYYRHGQDHHKQQHGDSRAIADLQALEGGLIDDHHHST